MKLYTKQGDGGSTSLMTGTRVLKSDDRIELLGTIDELSAQLGLAKVAACPKGKEAISGVQSDLMGLMAGIASPRDRKYKVQMDQITRLETEIDRMETSMKWEMKFVLYGGCELSARLDVARAVARRAERCFKRVALRYGADTNAMKYINRLSDYLYIAARYADYLEEQQAEKSRYEKMQEIEKERIESDRAEREQTKKAGYEKEWTAEQQRELDREAESIVRAVLKNLKK